jgi:hypothetical protein
MINCGDIKSVKKMTSGIHGNMKVFPAERRQKIPRVDDPGHFLAW